MPLTRRKHATTSMQSRKHAMPKHPMPKVSTSTTTTNHQQKSGNGQWCKRERDHKIAPAGKLIFVSAGSTAGAFLKPHVPVVHPTPTQHSKARAQHEHKPSAHTIAPRRTSPLKQRRKVPRQARMR